MKKFVLMTATLVLFPWVQGFTADTVNLDVACYYRDGVCPATLTVTTNGKATQYTIANTYDAGNTLGPLGKLTIPVSKSSVISFPAVTQPATLNTNPDARHPMLMFVPLNGKVSMTFTGTDNYPDELDCDKNILAGTYGWNCATEFDYLATSLTVTAVTQYQ